MTCTHRRLIVQKKTTTPISRRLVPIEDLLSKEKPTPISQRLVPIEDLLSKENCHTHITATCTHRRLIVQRELPHPYHSDLYPSKTYCPRRTTTPISRRLVPIEDLLSMENYHTHITATCSHRRPAVSGELLHPSHSDLYPSKALSSKENCHTHITATCSHWRSIEQGELIHPSHSDLWLWITYCPRITATPISQQLVAIEDLLSKENCYTHLTGTYGHG